MTKKGAFQNRKPSMAPYDPLRCFGKKQRPLTTWIEGGRFLLWDVLCKPLDKRCPTGLRHELWEIEMAITKGPWRVAPASEIYIVDEQDKDVFIIAPPFIPVAICRGPRGNCRDLIDTKANAALIAAAPEMYTLLLKLHHYLRSGPDGGDEENVDWEAFTIEVRYVIAKAMGIFDGEISFPMMEPESCNLPSKVTVDCRVGNSRE